MNNSERPPATRNHGLPPQLLPERPAREYLGGISLSTLKVIVGRGDLKSVTIGRRRLYARADLDQYIESLRSTSAA
jgi:hypothetical protein